MNLNWLRTFLVAAQLENFHQAADSLYLTQSSVSIQIQRLEDSLRVELFHKVGRNVVLTDAGREFLPYATKMVELFDQGQAHLNEWKHGYRGQVTLASSSLVASAFLPDLLSQFIVGHPDIDIITKVFHSLEVAGAVASGQADLGLCRIMPVRPDVHTSIVFADDVVFIAPQRCPASTYRDLIAAERLLVYNHPMWDQLLLEIQSLGLTPKVMNVSHVDVTKRFVAAGLGISFLPRHALGADLSADVQELPTPGLPKHKDHIYLVVSAKHHLSTAAEVLYDAICYTTSNGDEGESAVTDANLVRRGS